MPPTSPGSPQYMVITVPWSGLPAPGLPTCSREGLMCGWICAEWGWVDLSAITVVVLGCFHLSVPSQHVQRFGFLPPCPSRQGVSLNALEVVSALLHPSAVGRRNLAPGQTCSLTVPGRLHVSQCASSFLCQLQSLWGACGTC